MACPPLTVRMPQVRASRSRQWLSGRKRLCNSRSSPPPSACSSFDSQSLVIAARVSVPASMALLHGVEPEHITLGVHYEGDEAVLADGELALVNLAARFLDAGFLDRAILRGEIDDGAVAAGRYAIHPDERAGRAGTLFFHRERPDVVRAVELLQL